MDLPSPHELARRLAADAERFVRGPERDLTAPILAALDAPREPADSSGGSRPSAPGDKPRVAPALRSASAPEDPPRVAAAPRGTARRWRLPLRLVGLAAGVLLVVWIASAFQDPRSDQTSEPANTLARIDLPAAGRAPSPWVAVITPPPAHSRSPALGGPPSGPGGSLAPERWLHSGPSNPLRAVDRQLRGGLQRATVTAVDQAGDLALRLFSGAMAPLARLGGALSSPTRPR